MLKRIPALTVLVSALVLAGPVVQAGAIHDVALFTGDTLPRNDDGSTGLVSLGFTVNFYGSSYGSLYVNNNGNVTFDLPLGTYTPFKLLTTNRSMLAQRARRAAARRGARAGVGRPAGRGPRGAPSAAASQAAPRRARRPRFRPHRRSRPGLLRRPGRGRR